MAKNILERLKRLKKAVPDKDVFAIEYVDGHKETLHVEELFFKAMNTKYGSGELPEADEIKAIYYPKAQRSFVRLLKGLMVLDADSEEMPYLIEQKMYD